MFHGNVSNGTTTASNCYADRDCASGYCDESASVCPGKCHALVATGAACTSDSQCASGQVCDDGHGGLFCTAVSTTANASCPCADGLWCDESGGVPGKCQALVTATHDCTNPQARCKAGLICLGGTCQTVVGVGAACTAGVSYLDSVCGLGYYCDSTSHCASWPKVGDACSASSATSPPCIASYCDTVNTPHTCKAPTLAIDATCNPAFLGKDCLSGSCNFGTQKCVAATAISCSMP